MSALRRVCVYCASSRQAHPEFAEDARRLGRLLAERRITILYGGGSVGSMGALADGALAAHGEVIGVLPRFMYDLEWGHRGLTELRVVNDLHERKRLMIQEVDAVVALPGGSGTFEELLEAITWKRLGLYVNPIVIVNGRGYYEPLLALLESAVRERFMDDRHRTMWRVVDRADDVVRAIESSPPWGTEARGFATL
ncbi:MAG: TIGR00730 family Rossman fold protein [Planctomycetes bacterium]|nr:TIGR00730 family Rossman fold protein [Planctomycetota bacterium]MBI3843442.1 TIGR00730 family Rossman fold protein [Planctomycetota bacterium]